MFILILSCFLVPVVTFLFYVRSRRSLLYESKGRAVFISGCDTGIGHALAIFLSEQGCHVFAGCLDPETAQSKLPPSVNVVPLDVTDSKSVHDAATHVRAMLEKQDTDLWCLVNNAGVCIFGELDWMTEEQCNRMVQVNVLGTMSLTKAFIPLLRQSRGRVVVIGSVNGFIAYPGLAVYCGTKYFLEGFCDALRGELQRLDIGVVLVRPGDLVRVTNIMSRQSQEGNIMWEAMSKEDRLFYGDYFAKYQKAIIKNAGLTSPSKFENSMILKHLKHAIFAKEPRTRYFCVSIMARFIYYLISVLPDVWKDKLLTCIINRLIR